MDPLPSVTKVFAMVIQHERQLQIGVSILDEQRILTATANTRRPSYGRGRGSSGSGAFGAGRGTTSSKQTWLPPSHARFPGQPRVSGDRTFPSVNSAVASTHPSSSQMLHSQIENEKEKDAKTAPEHSVMRLTPSQHNTLLVILQRAEAHVPAVKDEKVSFP
ncbi:hypothetical protein PIB30_030835 [Stylosanthes scabra]|uniref:Uncharacterized protein n=1 Tax=Stylosanthes scabra TaxID=79078 RepID=A0ABU6TBG5_9FABA|nr:hypothetical protein [Stylosanthes scabra]